MVRIHVGQPSSSKLKRLTPIPTNQKLRLSRHLPLWLILPVLYIVIALALLNLPLNRWVAVHTFYLISWPTSHLLATESVTTQLVCSLIQWGIIGFLLKVTFKPRIKKQ